MKKFILALSFFAFAITTSSAQAKFGVQSSIGVSLAPDETTLSGEVFDYVNHEVTYKGTNLVKSYGLFGQQKFGYLFARAEAAYTNYQQEYRVRSFVQFGQGSKVVKESFQYIDFQVLAGLTHKNLRFGVGPVAHILLSDNNALDFISGAQFKTRDLTFGFATTVGLDAGRFHLDLRYINNFRTVGDHIYYGERDAGFKSKPHMVNLTFGVSI